MSWKPEVLVEGKWSGNALRFATKEEATEQVRDLMLRWTAPMDYRVVEVDDAVNYRYIEGRLVEVRK